MRHRLAGCSRRSQISLPSQVRRIRLTIGQMRLACRFNPAVDKATVFALAAVRLSEPTP